MGLADLCSRLLDVSKPALDQDPDWSFVDHLEKLPQWKWMFEKVDERMGSEQPLEKLAVSLIVISAYSNSYMYSK
eukprot:COSAG05_NODE_265_length_12666_cov_104.645739_4_plen_75_part_00